MIRGFGKETLREIRKRQKEFRKAEKEGRVMYDSDRCIIWIFDKEERKWIELTKYGNH